MSSDTEVVIYTRESCVHCDKIKSLYSGFQIDFVEKIIDETENAYSYQSDFTDLAEAGWMEVPAVVHGDQKAVGVQQCCDMLGSLPELN
jgi:glutaredoxin